MGYPAKMHNLWLQEPQKPFSIGKKTIVIPKAAPLRSASKMKQNLVLATAVHLSASQLKPFVVSFQMHQKDADLVFFTSQLTADTRKFLSENATELVDFSYFSIRRRHFECLLWPLCKPLFPLLKSEAARRTLARGVYNMVFLRFLLYLNYIESLAEKPRWIFLTDCRDAIFQGDLFARMETPGLYCFAEGKGNTIATSPGNRSMFKHCFKKHVLDELGHFEPLCSGTIVGDYESIRALLQTMVDQTMLIEHMKMVSGDDQGLYNYVIRKGLTPNIKIIDNDSGPIFTMGCMRPEQIQETPEHLILQKDGRPYAFLHQQDRFPQIVENHPVYKKVRNG